MSEFTFSQPTTPTSGLQAYSLERPVRNLAPGTLLQALTRKRSTRRRKAGGTNPMRKDHTMTAGPYRAMTETLAKSVTGIITAGENVDELLEKTFAEFGETLEAEATHQIDATVATRVDEARDELAKAAPVEEPLYKGLGVVGRLAGVVTGLARQIEALQKGSDFPGQSDGDDADKPSEVVSAFLDHALSASELALRQAVNEHVSLADDDDDDDGDEEMVVKSADGAGEFRVRANGLPDELVKFVCDPAEIDARVVDDAAAILVAYGADEALLAKAFPPGKDEEEGKGGDAPPPPAPAAEQGADQGADAGAEPAADPGVADDGAAGDPIAQLHVAGRLCAALMVQIDGILRQVEGLETDPNADPAAAGAAPNAAPNADAAPDAAGAPPADDEKDPPPGGMRKLADAVVGEDPRVAELLEKNTALTQTTVDLQKMVIDMSQKFDRFLAAPQPPRAIIAQGGGLAKQHDAAGSAAGLTPEEIAERLEKLAPEERARAAYSLSRGTPAETVLARY